MHRKSDALRVQSRPKSQKPTYDDKDQYGHPKIPFRGYFDRERCNQRRQWAEQFASCSLKHTGEWWRNEGEDDSCSCLKLKGNIENPIGLVKVPVAIAGPLLMFGDHIKGYVLCPFATTEGALVASVTRGATALMRSGGVFVKVVEQNQIRSPYFEFHSMKEVDVFLEWVEENMEALRKQVKLFSQHAELRKIIPTRLGRLVVLNFNFYTHDAAGQNMVTSSTWHLCKWILRMVEKELRTITVTNFCIESLLSGDKRVAHVNVLRTRGLHVQAEAWIPNSILKTVLKVTPEDLLKTYANLTSCSLQASAIGITINVNNVVAGVFLATGQDVACIAEGSIAHLIVRGVSKDEIEKQDQLHSTVLKKLSNVDLEPQVDIDESSPSTPYGGVYACVSIPSLVLGSVGGGTSLATQKECLNLMGCYGKDGVFRFGEIIAGFALSLEMSTLSSLSSGHFATAHEKLGRNHPTHGLKNSDLSSQLFSNILGADRDLIKATAFRVETGNSILSELTKSEMSKKVGHFGYKITYKDKSGSEQFLQVVLKSKPTGIETCNMINKMAQGCGLNLAVLYEKHKTETGFKLCHIREPAVISLENQDLKSFMPHVYYTLCDTSKDVYVIVMEYLMSDRFSLLNTADDVSGWTTNDIKVVLRDMAKIHSLYLNKDKQLLSKPWLEHVDMVRLTPLWRELLQHAHSEFPLMWTKDRVELMEAIIVHLPQMVAELASAPQTLIHNDCNPRNICLRVKPTTESVKHIQTTSTGGVPYSDPRILCIYDWELSTIGVPQHDLAEFLAFTIQPTTPLNERLELIEFYREHLEYYSGVQYHSARFLEIFNLATLKYAVNRLLMYTMAHTYKDYLFLPRVIDSNFEFIAGQLAQGTFPINHKAKAKL